MVIISVKPLLLLCVAVAICSAQLFPLQPNTAVVTCGSAQEGGYVMGIIDIRDPVCNAPPFRPDLPPPDNSNCAGPPNWVPPMHHDARWTKNNLGFEVFGLALDDESPPNIYILPTVIYYQSNLAPEKVYKVDGTTGDVTEFADLTVNGGQLGLGQIAYHNVFKQFYVSSFADGKIYRIAFDGTVLNSYKPLPASGTTSPVPFAERIFAVQVRYGEDRLYMGSYHGDQAPQKVYSVELDVTGDFISGSLVTEVDLATEEDLPNARSPIADIAFSAAGDMVLAERSMSNLYGFAAHRSTTWRLNGGTGNWEPNPVQYEVGTIASGFNSAGGVDFSDCLAVDDCNNGPIIGVTADAITFCYNTNPTQVVYGAQFLPATGGGLANSWAVDFDAETTGQDKSQNGDIEIVRGCRDGVSVCRIGVSCPEDVEVGCDDDRSVDALGNVTFTASGACENISFSVSDEETDGGISRTFTIMGQPGEDDTGFAQSSCVQHITTVGGATPDITCPADVQVECGSPTGVNETGQATTTADADITHSDSSVLGCGDTETIVRTFTASNECGDISCNQTITVVDTTAPTQNTSASICLWPPNHKFACFDLDSLVIGTDTCGNISLTYTSCESSQPVDDVGDGSHSADCYVDNSQICLRAERQGTDTVGRTYTITYLAEDSCSNQADFTREVFVPHSEDNFDTLGCIAGTINDNGGGKGGKGGKGRHL